MRMNTKVSAVKCKTYEEKEVRHALRTAIDDIDGFDFIRPGIKVAVKVNLVTAMKPETAATTNYTAVVELCRLLIERGAHVVVGDSPGGPFTPIYLNMVYSATGITAAESVGAHLNRNFEMCVTEYKDAVSAKKFSYTSWLDDVDVIINFSKLKTHAMMGMSCAVKNMFGVVPGTIKPEYHFRFPESVDFANMLIDLNEYFKPVLCITDAVVGMEGNGPTQGAPREIGAFLASKSPYALDLACAYIIGLDATGVKTLEAAYSRGLCPKDISELTVCGDIDSLRISDFKTIETFNSIEFFDKFQGVGGKLFGKFAGACLASRPSLKKSGCIGCQKCFNVCPAKAISMKKNRPVIDRKNCIRCFCCQEFCPEGALYSMRPFIARLIGGNPDRKKQKKK